MPTSTPTTDPIRAAYLAHVASRPQIDPHTLATTGQITTNAREWLRSVYRNLDGRPDLQQYARRAGEQLNTLLQRLDEEARAGRAH